MVALPWMLGNDDDFVWVGEWTLQEFFKEVSEAGLMLEHIMLLKAISIISGLKLENVGIFRLYDGIIIDLCGRANRAWTTCTQSIYAYNWYVVDYLMFANFSYRLVSPYHLFLAEIIRSYFRSHRKLVRGACRGWRLCGGSQWEVSTDCLLAHTGWAHHGSQLEGCLCLWNEFCGKW